MSLPPGAGLWDLAGRIGAPRALRDLGMPEDGIPRAVALALDGTCPNPRKPDAAFADGVVASRMARTAVSQRLNWLEPFHLTNLPLDLQA